MKFSTMCLSFSTIGRWNKWLVVGFVDDGLWNFVYARRHAVVIWEAHMRKEIKLDIYKRLNDRAKV